MEYRIAFPYVYNSRPRKVHLGKYSDNLNPILRVDTSTLYHEKVEQFDEFEEEEMLPFVGEFENENDDDQYEESVWSQHFEDGVEYDEDENNTWTEEDEIEKRSGR